MDTTQGTTTPPVTNASDTTSDVNQVNAALTSADTTVNQGIAALGLVHQARLSRATRTVAALTAQYGAGDPRVTAAQASVNALNNTIVKISMVGQQLTVPVVQVAAAGWALQGYVLDTNSQPTAKYTVYMADANNIFLKQYGFAYTDATGYFVIDYAGGTDQPAAPQLFIAVLDNNANPVYLSSTAFQPTLGTVTFQNITVPAGGQTIGDPSRTIRDAAFPPSNAGAKS